MNVDGDLRHLTSEEIQDLLDQGLSPSETARVQEHLSSCTGCRREVEAWSLLFRELDGLPELAPGPAFSRAILAKLPIRLPLAVRVRSWLAARAGGKAHTGHLSPEGIQDYLDQLLPVPGTAQVEAHLASCTSCRREVEAWKAVFGSLGDVERLAPSPDFPERVMARVRIPAPVPVPAPQAVPAASPVLAGLFGHRILSGIPVVLGRALAVARHALPRTRRGWAIAGGVASAPTITLLALFYMVFSRPLMSAGVLLSYASWKVSALMSSVVGLLGDRLLESATLFRLWEGLGAMAVSPLLLGTGGVVFSLLCVVSLRVLHRNLLLTPSDEGYAHVRV